MTRAGVRICWITRLIAIASIVMLLAAQECVAQSRNEYVWETTAPVRLDRQTFIPLYGASLEGVTAVHVEGNGNALFLDVGRSFDLVAHRLVYNGDEPLEIGPPRLLPGVSIGLDPDVRATLPVGSYDGDAMIYGRLGLIVAANLPDIYVAQARARFSVLASRALGDGTVADRSGWIADVDVVPFAMSPSRLQWYGVMRSYTKMFVRLSLSARAIRQQWLDNTMISLGTGAEIRWRPIPGPLILRAGAEVRLRLGDDRGIDHSLKGGIKIGEPYGRGLYLEATHRKGLMSASDLLTGEGSRLELGVGYDW